jgi:hypothetical protein
MTDQRTGGRTGRETGRGTGGWIGRWTGEWTGQETADAGDVDALITDRYLESILVAHSRGADAGPIPAAERPPTDVRQVSDWLVRGLPRLHPSFRFEEALAATLMATAARMRLHLAAGSVGNASSADSAGVVVPLEVRPSMEPSSGPSPIDGHEDRLEVPVDHRPVGIGRPWLIGGALTSAVLSLVGGVYVAWRIGRGRRSPMARAVRAVARTRPV